MTQHLSDWRLSEMTFVRLMFVQHEVCPMWHSSDCNVCPNQHLSNMTFVQPMFVRPIFVQQMLVWHDICVTWRLSNQRLSNWRLYDDVYPTWNLSNKKFVQCDIPLTAMFVQLNICPTWHLSNQCLSDRYLSNLCLSDMTFVWHDDCPTNVCPTDVCMTWHLYYMKFVQHEACPMWRFSY
jgi:hypothetical protein